MSTAMLLRRALALWIGRQASALLEDLMRYVGRVFDCDDNNARKMSNPVARSLYGHDAGVEYLYLRSKVFRTNRTEPLTV